MVDLFTQTDAGTLPGRCPCDRLAVDAISKRLLAEILSGKSGELSDVTITTER